MRCLLTGISGQVGAVLAAPLARFDAVIPADRSVLDLAKPDSLPAVLDQLAPDLIVNPAA